MTSILMSLLTAIYCHPNDSLVKLILVFKSVSSILCILWTGSLRMELQRAVANATLRATWPVH